jgi:hypothetical protein
MACKHSFAKWNDVIFCYKCGLTVTCDGKPIFDRKLHNCLENKTNRRGRHVNRKNK